MIFVGMYVGIGKLLLHLDYLNLEKNKIFTCKNVDEIFLSFNIPSNIPTIIRFVDL